MVFDGIEYVLVSSKSLGESKNAIVEFVISGLSRSDSDISVDTIDVSGNFVECSAYFTLDDTILRDPYLRALEDHAGWVRSIAFSPDGGKIATATSTPSQENGMLRLWDTDTGQHLRTLAPPSPYGEAIECIAFRPDGRRIAGGIGEGKVHLWNVNTGKLLQTLSLGTWSTSVAFRPDGKRILAGGLGNAHLWNTSTGRLIRTLSTGVWTSTYVSFSLNGERIAALNADESVSTWNINTGRPIRTFKSDRFKKVAFSPNGKKIATVNFFADPEVRLWNVNTGKHLQTLSHPVEIWSVAFSPDGNIIATGSNNGTIRLWNTNTGKHLQTLRGHVRSTQIMSFAFSPDGAILASGNNIGEVLLWEIHKGQIAAAPADRGLSTFPRQNPKTTMLLSNYPNPFNPETWIPYQLAAPSEVSISIYAVDGQLVRRLALGHQPVGIYQNRSRAAYWDGRNAQGEPVASGVYFYTLTAGEFTATRKMLIRK